MARQFDVAIVGAGHNGLVAASYIARTGRSVFVSEKRDQVGGACVTEEFIPGYKFSACAFLFGLFRPQILRDLELARFGLEAYSADPIATGIFDGGAKLLLWRDLDKSLREISRFGEREVEGFLEFGMKLQRFAKLVEPWLLRPPPNAEELAHIFREAGAESLQDEFFYLSIADLLARHFRSPELRGFLTFLSMVSIHAGPYFPGTSYQYAHHAWGEFDGTFGLYGYVRGGIGGVTAALGRCATHHGAVVETSNPVSSIRVRDGAADGLVLDSGEEVDARVVISNADPRSTLLKLLPADALTAEHRALADRFDTRGSMARIHLATSEPPLYTAFSSRGVGPEHQGHQLLGPSVARFEQAWRAQEAGELPDEFVIELVMQSAHDPTVAPAGHHTVVLGVQNLPFELNGGWDNRSEEFADRVMDQLSVYAPNLKNAVVGRHVITPLDLQRTWSLPEGNIFQGAQTLPQLFSHRPFPGWSRYRMPVRNLYLCGSGAHPGGGVTGAPGHNAAHEVLHDLQHPVLDQEEWLRRASAGASAAEIRDGSALLGLQDRLWRRPALRQLAVRAAQSRWSRALARRMLRTGR